MPSNTNSATCPGTWCIVFELWYNLYCPQIISANLLSFFFSERKPLKAMCVTYGGMRALPYTNMFLLFVLLAVIFFYSHKLRFYHANVSWANKKMNVSCSLKQKNNTFFSWIWLFIGRGELQQNTLAKFYQSVLLGYVTLENSSMQGNKNPWIKYFLFFSLARLQWKTFCQIL